VEACHLEAADHVDRFVSQVGGFSFMVHSCQELIWIIEDVALARIVLVNWPFGVWFG
jgi:hypothetical protein